MKRPPAGTIPDAPGSYQFKDALGRVIYVGKASSLRQRLSNYFGDPRNMHPRTAQMVGTAASVEWIEVRNEVEALMLEYSLIKEHRPRFNVRLLDDKSYPFLAITVGDEWPRAMVMRGRKRKGTRYFGPYSHAYAIRDTLDELLKTFPIRSCSPSKFNQHHRLGRPCLLYHIEKCVGPCVGEIEEMPYRQLVEEMCDFLGGDTDEIVKRLESSMRAAASELEFERAARLRDRLVAVQRVIAKQQMVADRSEDIDVIGIAQDDLEAAVQVFYVRAWPGGRAQGLHRRQGRGPDTRPAGRSHPRSAVRRRAAARRAEAGARAGRARRPPDLRGVAVPPPWVAGAGPCAGARRQALAAADGHPQRRRGVQPAPPPPRASDHNSRSRALTELQDLLGLPEAPLRIECYDMAHLQGSDYVGSMVVFEDGLPNKREYRRFKVKNVPGNDDYAAMQEVLTRRLTAYLADRDGTTDDLDASGGDVQTVDAVDDLQVGSRTKARQRGRFSYPPQLLVVDGGKGQLGVADQVVHSLGLEDEIPLASLAKRFEEVYVPGRAEPVEVPRGSDALFLLQRLRDEAHRFANTFHRELRAKRMTASSLDGIPGLGETRRKRLVQTMGGVNAVKAASLDDLKALSFLPDAVAEAIHAKFHPA